MNIKEDIWKRIMFSSEFMYNAVEKYRFRKAIFLLPFSLKSFFETNRKKDILRKNNYIYNINVSNNIKLYHPLIDNGDMLQNKIFFSEDFYEGNILRHITYKYISYGKQENKYTIVDVGGI